MNKDKIFYLSCFAGAIFSLMLLALVLTTSQFNYKEFSLKGPSGDVEKIERPGFMDSRGAGFYELNGQLVVGLFASKQLRIIPDDEIKSLEVNGRIVSLASIPAAAKKDYRIGFAIDLTDYLNKGSNEITVRYYDRGGLMGVVLASEGGYAFHAAIAVTIAAALLLLALCLMRLLNVNRTFQLIFIGGMLIRVFYFAITPPDTRAHDLGDHIGYVEYLSENWAPPSVDKAVGGAYFHPPFYYYTGAVVYKISSFFEPDNKLVLYKVQQALCLLYSLGFLFFGLLIIKRFLEWYAEDTDTSASGQPNTRAKSIFGVIAILFAFWPVAIIHSGRIGNDPLLYFLFSASLYFIMLWYRSDVWRYLFIASLIGSFAILTKANGEILIAVLGIAGLYKMIRSKQWMKYVRAALIPCLLMFTATGITVAPGLILKLEGKRDKLYIDNIDGLSKANLVGNTAVNYFWFDVKTFITEPYTDPYDDRMGRQYFWNYLAKTGLFGEFKYSSLQSTNAAVVCSFLFVLMMLYIIAGLYNMKRSDFKLFGVVGLAGFFLWAGVTYMRITFPANIDFRYIVPILITFCVLYALSILSFYRIGAVRMANIGRVIALLFSVCSVLFITGI